MFDSYLQNSHRIYIYITIGRIDEVAECSNMDSILVNYSWGKSFDNYNNYLFNTNINE